MRVNPHSFDAVRAIGSLLHVSQERLPRLLFEVRRTLKPESIMVSSMKNGSGEVVDERGKFFAFYSLRERETIMADNGFNVIEVEEMTEVRENESGEKEIVWIVSFARAIAKELAVTSRSTPHMTA
ncbi:MAG: class I SAM-dependent methyltransferase [Acidobacteriota bacterium]